MSGRVIAVANMKGGVGKTVTVIALSQALCADNPAKKVCILDFDAQASASFCVAGDLIHTLLITSGKTVDAFLEDYWINEKTNGGLTSRVRNAVSTVAYRNQPFDISLIASSPDLRIVERALLYTLSRSGLNVAQIEAKLCRLISHEMESLQRNYDYLIIDCPPGISLLTEAAIRVADLVIVPTIPDYLSVLGLNAFKANAWDRLAAADGPLPPPKSMPHVLITRYRKDNREHLKNVNSLTTLAAERGQDFKLFKTKFPESVVVPRATERMANDVPLFMNLWSRLVPTLQDLCSEVLDAIDMVQPTARKRRH